MKKMSRSIKSVKTSGASSPQRAGLYRRFIPDARPSTAIASRGHFWYRVWLNLRSSP